MVVQYDKILASIGEFGPYQKRLCFILCILVIPSGMHLTSTVFNNFTPSFRCAVPHLSNDTYAFQSTDHVRLVKASIPYDKDDGHFSHCDVYVINGSSLDHVTNPGRNKTHSCDRWVYDTPSSSQSLSVEFNLVCERELYKAHCNMMMLFGILVGSLLGGPLSDYFGRKKLFIGATVAQNLIAGSLAFVQSPPLVMVCRFFITFTGSFAFLPVLVLLTEVVGVNKRSIAAMFSMFGYTAGLFVVVLVQYIFRDWRTAQLVQSLPFLTYALFWWFIPESPRWLLTKGRTQEAKAIIKYMAKVNRAELPAEMMYDGTEMLGSCEKTAKSDGTFSDTETRPEEVKIWHICSRLDIAIRITVLCFSWIVVNMVYYGLVLGVGDLIRGNIFINFTLQSAMELLGNAICVFVLEKTGRKKIFCSAMLVSGVALLGIALLVMVEADIRWLSVVLYCIGKLGISVGFSLIFIVTTELLPTMIRNSGLGFCSCVARFSGIVSPYIVSASLLVSGAFGQAFPLIIFGTFSLMSGLSAMLLPETRNAKLPETFDDHEKTDRVRL